MEETTGEIMRFIRKIENAIAEEKTNIQELENKISNAINAIEKEQLLNLLDSANYRLNKLNGDY